MNDIITTKAQWGLQTEDGEVYNINDYPPVRAWPIKDKRTRIVTRTITITASDWEKV